MDPSAGTSTTKPSIRMIRPTLMRSPTSAPVTVVVLSAVRTATLSVVSKPASGLPTRRLNAMPRSVATGMALTSVTRPTPMAPSAPSTAASSTGRGASSSEPPYWTSMASTRPPDIVAHRRPMRRASSSSGRRCAIAPLETPATFTAPPTSPVSSTSRIAVQISTPTRSCASTVDAARCGVRISRSD